ncbi:MAG: alpha-mannosidase [Candidatus Eremiobacteraeota bacterium]|nr:alpha-mannosidase [Candidatus Eremiobacteraeota bacterium]
MFTASLPGGSEPIELRYDAPAGALARVDGRVAGAFDREHRRIVLDPAPHARTLQLECERHSLPTNGLPPGPGLRWTIIKQNSKARPARAIEIAPQSRRLDERPAAVVETTLWGHSHLDVAWLWTYDDAKRKALRTFANAVALLESDRAFVFMQSQPQLFEFVREADAAFFARVAEYAARGRFDADVAALWVEPDCNVPSGESLLRQMLFAHRYCVEHFGIEPSIAWLPDTFGFARTLPSLLAHAGIPYFATTKLSWNDTTRFPYEQFRWRGPDGAEVLGASFAGMDSGTNAVAAERARQRREPLVVGYGDGGGGPTREQLHEARALGRWERPRAWFERLDARRGSLPVHDDELYLEYHRGVFTTHHDIKAENASLERRLRDAEEQVAWCVAVRAPHDVLTRMRAALHDAWRVVLRNQFHDVLPGTSIEDVYADARREYLQAHESIDAASQMARATLPQPARTPATPALCAPQAHDDGYLFQNRYLRALVRPTGAIAELTCGDGGPNAVTQANALALYQDRPAKWEAWNIDAGYERTRKAARPQAPHLVDAALEIPFDLGRSRATMRVSLAPGEPFLRVELAVDWRERRTLLRLENWLALDADSVRYGAPHGVVTRSARDDTPERKARFEVPGQRFAAVAAPNGNGIACLALDTYGWSARALENGGVRLGHSLLRSTAWPDPQADRGVHTLVWAFAPLRDATVSDVERMWLQFAGASGVRLFESDRPNVLVVACKPAEDGDGIVVRVRECDGAGGPFALRCGGRMRAVQPVDGCERDEGGDGAIDGESLRATIVAYGLRAFRVRF